MLLLAHAGGRFLHRESLPAMRTKARVAHGCCVEPFVAAGKVLELLSAAPRNTVRVTERNEDRPKLLAKVLAIPAELTIRSISYT
jgi:hypothetical protein